MTTAMKVTTNEAIVTNRVFKFVLMAFGFSWLFWLPAVLAGRGLIALPVPAGMLTTIGAFGPMLAALILSVQDKGLAGTRASLGHALRWRVSPVWYVVALVGPFLYQAAGMGLHMALGGQPPDMGELVGMLPGVLFNFLISVLFVGLAEEIGWRGFVLPSLQSRSNALVASLMVGGIWGLWHLPLFFNPTSSYGQVPFVAWLVFLLPMSIVHTWLYNSTRGAVLMAVLLHAMVNATGNLWLALPDIGPIIRQEPRLLLTIYMLQAVVLWAATLVITLRYDWRDLARPARYTEPL
jgi:uncharacterized protein